MFMHDNCLVTCVFSSKLIYSENILLNKKLSFLIKNMNSIRLLCNCMSTGRSRIGVGIFVGSEFKERCFFILFYFILFTTEKKLHWTEIKKLVYFPWCFDHDKIESLVLG